jgi:hypothetical protein
VAAARDRQKHVRNADRRFQRDLRRINEKHPPGSVERGDARRDRVNEHARTLNRIESGKRGCTVTALALLGNAVITVAARKGWT